jgi:hypothetical protein
MNPNEAVRRLRVLARDSRDEEWSGLFLALDSRMCDGDGLPDDWRKHRFDVDPDRPDADTSPERRGTTSVPAPR